MRWCRVLSTRATTDRGLGATTGTGDPALREAYARCRQLNARHGKTYFLATRLLTPQQRPAIHALYGFARLADDLVDDLDSDHTPVQRGEQLDRLQQVLQSGLRAGHSDHPVLAALVDTVQRHGIAHSYFDQFLHSMRMDLTTTDYSTRAELRTYVRGSAEVIGLQVLPVLGTVAPREEAAPHAAALGAAFQLTNFLRDVAEDLDRDRVYLPADELAAHGVDRDRLWWCRRRGRSDLRVRRALADQVARTLEVYRRARPGIAMLDPVSRPCVATAYTLYGEILDHLVRCDYEVFSQRATVPRTRRLGVAASAVGRTVVARTSARLRS